MLYVAVGEGKLVGLADDKETELDWGAVLLTEGAAELVPGVDVTTLGSDVYADMLLVVRNIAGFVVNM